MACTHSHITWCRYACLPPCLAVACNIPKRSNGPQSSNAPKNCIAPKRRNNPPRPKVAYLQALPSCRLPHLRSQELYLLSDACMKMVHRSEWCMVMFFCTLQTQMQPLPVPVRGNAPALHQDNQSRSSGVWQCKTQSNGWSKQRLYLETSVKYS